ncbi:MAG: sigma factor [Chitinophagaceae bacterium]
MQQNELIPHLFRTEYGKIVAVLCNTFGLQHIEVAEDIASDTFLKASEVWSIKGAPPNPAAWLYTVAKNKTKDYFKHQAVIEAQIKQVAKEGGNETEQYEVFTEQNIADSQLSMIFAVCSPANPIEAQICLALQILCGFSVEEVANAFLAKPETIKKRLLRARGQLRNDNFQIRLLGEKEVKERLEAVIKTLYLLFNEGYFSKTNSQLIRKELCAEATRLAIILSENPLTNTTSVNALLALFCFQGSRLDARINEQSEAILFDQQDKNLWDKSLIERGNYYMTKAFRGDEFSNYHLEAGIAYWHACGTEENKWPHILRWYDQLVLIEHSPVTALNRLFALAKCDGNEKAIAAAEKMALEGNGYYHALLGYLYASTDVRKAIEHYQKAIAITKSKTEQQAMAKEIKRLTKDL